MMPCWTRRILQQQMSSDSACGCPSSDSTMPIELAMPLFLSNEEFLNSRPSEYSRPLRPCLHTYHASMLSFSSPTEQSDLKEVPGRTKKRVTFADHKGFNLTTVKVFSEFDDPIDVPTNTESFFSSSLTLSEEKEKLTLDFDQPSADYVKFRQRVENDHVCLEHCMLREKSIAGTIRVKNVSFEKSVKLRVTFDTWKSFTDVECQYVQDTYTGLNRDTFSFEANLPEQVPPHERIEFAICYEVNGLTFWDNNQGQNYRIVQSALKKSSNDSSGDHERYGMSDWDVHFDRYGSPRCSHGIFPSWPSYAGYEDIGPYY